jgi:hypothetical protein
LGVRYIKQFISFKCFSWFWLSIEVWSSGKQLWLSSLANGYTEIISIIAFPCKHQLWGLFLCPLSICSLWIAFGKVTITGCVIWFQALEKRTQVTLMFPKCPYLVLLPHNLSVNKACHLRVNECMRVWVCACVYMKINLEMGTYGRMQYINSQLWAISSNVLGAGLKASTSTTSLFLWGVEGVIRRVWVIVWGRGMVFVQFFLVTKLIFKNNILIY